MIHRFQPIAKVPALDHKTYVPRGGTPLLDALGRGINDLEQKLAQLPAPDQPAKIVVVVVTDGRENSSREFNTGQVKKMIAEKTERDGWQFVFLSADLSAVHEGMNLGIQMDKVLMYEKSRRGTGEAWSAVSGKTSEFRKQAGDKFAFDEGDRKHPRDPNKKKD